MSDCSWNNQYWWYKCAYITTYKYRLFYHLTTAFLMIFKNQYFLAFFLRTISVKVLYFPLLICSIVSLLNYTDSLLGLSSKLRSLTFFFDPSVWNFFYKNAPSCFEFLRFFIPPLPLIICWTTVSSITMSFRYF